MKKALAAGILLLIAAGMVFAGGGGQAGAGAAQATGEFNWKRYSGEEITVYMVEHQTSQSIVKKLQEFQTAYGDQGEYPDHPGSELL